MTKNRQKFVLFLTTALFITPAVTDLTFASDPKTTNSAQKTSQIFGIVSTIGPQETSSEGLSMLMSFNSVATVYFLPLNSPRYEEYLTTALEAARTQKQVYVTVERPGKIIRRIAYTPDPILQQPNE